MGGLVLDEIRRLLDRRATFHCKHRGGGFQTRDFLLAHTIERIPSSTEFPDWLPASMHRVLSESGTMVLFHPEDLPEEGFRLFSADECVLHRALFRKTIEEARQMLGDAGADDPARQETWMNGLCPIAEVMASGDYFAIDTESARGQEECPIIYLDHEYYFSGWLDSEEVEIVASDVVELVKIVLKDPLKYLDAHWTGGDPYDQWFPESVSFSS